MLGFLQNSAMLALKVGHLPGVFFLSGSFMQNQLMFSSFDNHESFP